MSMPGAASGQVAGSSRLGDRTKVMALVGLAASLLTAVVLLPHLTQVGGFGLFILLMLLLAMRRKGARPSVGDVVLLGLYVGTGFALYEDALYGRGNPDLAAAPVLSLIFPNLVHWETGATSYLGVGHPVFTGALALGLGVAILYRRRHKLAWLAAPVGVLLAIGQHAVGNTLLALGEKSVLPVTVLSYLSLKGWLGPLLLILGTAVIVWLEWRHALRRPHPRPTAKQLLRMLRRAVWLPPAIAAQRSHRLAMLQKPPASPNRPPAPAGQPVGQPPAGQASMSVFRRSAVLLAGLLTGALVMSCTAAVDQPTPPSSAPPTNPTAPPPSTPAEPSPWQQTLQQVRPDGTVDVETALSAFVQAIGPVPGVKSPGPSTNIGSGTIAIRWILGHWSELTAAQRVAVGKAIGASAPAGGVEGGPPRPEVPCRTTDTPGTEPFREAFDEVRSQLEAGLWPLRADVQVSFAKNNAEIAVGGKPANGYAVPCGVTGPTEKISGCTIHVNPSAAALYSRQLLIHEVAHCLMFSRFGAVAESRMPAWFSEGAPEWMAYVLSGEHPADLGWWPSYLTAMSQSKPRPLSSLTYDGMGFFVHLDESKIDPWAAIRAVAERLAKVPTTAAGWEAAAPNQQFLETWGSGMAQGRYPGDAWRTGTARLDQYQLPIDLEALDNGTKLPLKATPYAPKATYLRVTAEVIDIAPAAGASGRISLGGTADATLSAVAGKYYCTLGEEACRCPDNSPHGAGFEFKMMTPGTQWIGFTGGSGPATVTLKGTSLEEFCKPNRCLVGSWTTTSVKAEVSGIQSGKGAAGISMKIDKSGAVTVDYSQSARFDATSTTGGSATAVWRGSHQGKVELPKSGKAGSAAWKATPGGVDTVTITSESIAGTDTHKLRDWLGLGISPGIPSVLHSSGTWTCDGDRLALSVRFAIRANSFTATGLYTFKRVSR